MGAKALLWLSLPFMCVWFPDVMGDFAGSAVAPGMSGQSPGWLVRIGGWGLLLLYGMLPFIPRLLGMH